MTTLASIVLAGIGTSCMEPGKGSGATNKGAPSGLTYATNPATYTINQAITANVLTARGSAVDKWEISGTLPAGLSFDSVTGVVSGTPTALMPMADYTVSGRNGSGASYVNLKIAVVDVPPTITYGGSTTKNYVVGTTIADVVPTLGGGATTSCAASPALPAGLSLGADCRLSGKPLEPVASATYSIIAINSGGRATLSLTITVIDVPPVFSYSPTTLPLTRGTQMSTLTPTSSGGAITGCSSSPTLPAGLSLSNTCVLSGTPTAIAASAPYVITATNSGGSANRTLTIAVTDALPNISYAAGPFAYTKGTAIATLSATNTGGVIDSCVALTPLPTGLSISSSTCAITGTPTAVTASAAYSIRAANTAGTSTTSVTIQIKDIAPTLSISGSPFVYTNQTAISPILPTLGGGAVTSCTSTPGLPSGLAINATTCAITGTPTAIKAAADYVIAAQNSGGIATQTINIRVKPRPPVLSYPGSPFKWPKNTGITTIIPGNTGDPATACVSSPPLPNGVNLSADCRISGTPSAVTPSSTYDITGTNSEGTSTVTITVDVPDAVPAIVYASSPFTFTKDVVALTATATNTGGVITNCVAPGLPAGLVISATTCAISGTPTALAAAADYTVTASNSGGNATATVNIAVIDHAPVVSYPSSPYLFHKGTAISTLSVTNTGSVITSCSMTGTLPAGLAFDTTTCNITGTPSAITAPSSITVTATNTGGSASAAVVIEVKDAAPTLSYSPSALVLTKSVLMAAATPTIGGGAITACTSSPSLPPGLTLNNTTCEVTGTPTSIRAEADYVITASNGGGSATATLTVTVNDAVPALSYAGSPLTYVKGTTIATLVPTSTGGAITGCSASPALPQGLAISSGCQISGTPTAVSGSTAYTITATNTGGSGTANITITVNDAKPSLTYPSSPYTFTKGSAITTFTPVNAGGTIASCAITAGSLPAGLSFNTTNCAISGTPTTVGGAATLTITATNATGSDPEDVVITVNDAAPVISYPASPFGYTINLAMTTLSPTNTGGTITGCTITPALPAGISYSATTCNITGTPTAVTVSNVYTVVATNSGGSSSVAMQLSINDVAPTLSYATTGFTYTKGTAIASVTPTIGGGTITSCTSSPSLPSGLSLNATTCVISGTPTVVRAQTDYVITAANSGGSATQTLTITVNDVIPAISYAGSPLTYVKGTAISSLVPTSTGGTVTDCSASPTLPAGLSLSSTCTISGTPSVVAASASYTITATNSGGSATTAITIAVNDIAPTMTFSTTTFTYTHGTAIAAVTPTIGGGAITSCTSSPALPSGLALSQSTCQLTGTPATYSGVTTYTITASNSGGSIARAIDITVNAIAPSFSYAAAPFTFTKNTSVGTITPINSGDPFVSCTDLTGLPAGLSLSSSCVITGTPTGIVSTATYQIRGSNTGGNTTVNVSITVNDQAPSIAFAGGTHTLIVREAMSTISATSSGGAITGCTAPGGLPSGLSVNATTCAITGTPTVTSAATSYTVRASNTGGNFDATVTLKVKDQPQILFYGKTAVDGSSNGTAPSSDNVWKVSYDGQARTALTANTAANLDSRDPTFSADGSQVFMISKRALNGSTNGTATSSFNIWKTSGTGSSPVADTSHTVANLDSDGPVIISPNGTKLAFLSKMKLTGIDDDVAASGSYNVWIMNTDGSVRVPLTKNTNNNLNSAGIVWSPDGSYIYFSSQMKLTTTSSSWNKGTESAYNIWKVNVSTGDLTALTAETGAGAGDCTEPALSPDGTTIAYTSKQAISGTSTSSSNIWTMNAADGSGATALTSDTANNKDSKQPSYSPDGTEIAFASKRSVSGSASSSFNVWKMSYTGASKVALTTDTAANLDSERPLYSPDSLRISFRSKRTLPSGAASSYNIWVMKSDGTSLLSLTNNRTAGMDSDLPSSNAWYAE